MKFHVTNPDGSEPDFQKLRKEDWYVDQNLPYPQFKPYFVLSEYGGLLLLSSNFVCACPPGRFVVHFEDKK